MDTALATTTPQSRPVKRKQRHRLLWADAEAIALKCAERRMTELEACARLDISYKTWADFKARNGNSQAFTDLLTRARAAKLDVLIGAIEDQGLGKLPGVKPDWRALQWMSDRVIATDGRFNDHQHGQAQPGTNSMTDECMARLLSMLKSSQPQKQVIDIAEVKQLKQGD